MLERRVRRWLFVTAAATFAIVQEGAITVYDGQTVYEVTRAIVDRGSLAISQEFSTLPGSDGRLYGRYGLGLSLLAAVPYGALRPIVGHTAHADALLEAAVSFSMALVSAGLLVALYALARRLGARTPAALLVSAGAVAGTYTLPYVKEFFSEPLTALCLVVAIERLLAGGTSAAGLALGAGILVRPQCILMAPLVLLVAWSRHGLSGAGRAVLGVVPGIAVTLAYNVVRFGNPLLFGYDDVGFTTPFLSGTAGLLFHPLKSLPLFAPISLLLPFAMWHLWRTRRSAAVLIVGNFSITFMTVAMWFAWHGGWSWGPRLLIPGLLPVIAALGPWLERPARQWIAVLLFVAGFAVSFPALIVSTQTQQLEEAPISREELWRGHYMATQPLRSPRPLRQTQLVIPVARYSFDHAYERLDDGRNYLRYLSLWQFGVTRVFRRTGLIAALAVSALLLSAAFTAARRTAAAAKELNEIESGSLAPGARP